MRSFFFSHKKPYKSTFFFNAILQNRDLRGLIIEHLAAKDKERFFRINKNNWAEYRNSDIYVANSQDILYERRIKTSHELYVIEKNYPAWSLFCESFIIFIIGGITLPIAGTSLLEEHPQKSTRVSKEKNQPILKVIIMLMFCVTLCLFFLLLHKNIKIMFRKPKLRDDLLAINSKLNDPSSAFCRRSRNSKILKTG